MIEQQKISQRQAFYFILSTAFGTIIFLHSEVINLAGRGGWIAEIAGIFMLIPLALWTLFLARLAPGHTILEILEAVMGKFIGRIIGGIYALISIALTALILRLITGMIRVFFLDDTPFLVTGLIILVLAAVIVDGGIEGQGRMGEVLEILLLSVFFFGVGIGFFSQLNSAFFIPLFDRGIADFSQGVYLSAGFVAEVILFLIVMVAALPWPADSYWVVTKGFLWAGTILGFAALSIIGVFSAEEAARMSFGGINVALNLRIGKFIQGVEVFVIIPFILLSILNVAAHLYAGWVAERAIVNNWRPQILFGGTVALTAVLFSQVTSFNEAYFLSILLGRYVTLPFTVLVLLLTSIGVLIRGGKVAEKI